MIEGCYCRAVELLNDVEDCVRSAAVRVVITWGLVLERKRHLSDEIFVNFLSVLNDNDGHVRSALRKLLKLAKLPGLVTFQLSSNGLLESLESYPQVLSSLDPYILGRISHALGDIMDQRTVFAYLLQKSKHIGLSDLGFNPDVAPCSPTPGSSVNDILAMASLKTPAMIHEQGQKDDDVIESVNTILSKVQDIWPLIQSGVLHEVLRTLRFCKEGLGVFT
ncbi:unnamed protein product [Citrullus colocynthis]|uniref:Uncharacterized protein n=1 Tax=Citrullus colocynthis TaxID=252529 RepID=A0ABP0YS81_9ROSI